MRALRWTFFRRPSPGRTNTPVFLVSLTAVSTRFSRNAAAVLLLVPTFSAIARTSWVLVKPAMSPPCEFAAMGAAIGGQCISRPEQGKARKPVFMRVKRIFPVQNPEKWAILGLEEAIRTRSEEHTSE